MTIYDSLLSNTSPPVSQNTFLICCGDLMYNLLRMSGSTYVNCYIKEGIHSMGIALEMLCQNAAQSLSTLPTDVILYVPTWWASACSPMLCSGNEWGAWGCQISTISLTASKYWLHLYFQSERIQRVDLHSSPHKPRGPAFRQPHTHGSGADPIATIVNRLLFILSIFRRRWAVFRRSISQVSYDGV